MAVGGGGPPVSPADGEPFELWWMVDGRFRSEQADSVEVRAGGKVITFHPLLGPVERPDDDPHQRSIPLTLSARSVLAELDFRIVDSVQWHDRSTWSVSGTPTQNRQPGLPPQWIHVLPGHDYLLHIDKATGVIVVAEGRFDDETVSWVRIDSLEVDLSIDERVFQYRPPEGVAVRTPEEVTLENLRQQGVDVSDIDVRDRDQVQDAARRHYDTVFARHRAPTVEELAEHVPILGPPPADERAAFASVADAFREMDALSSDDEDLVMVERGEGLGDCLRDAGRRYGPDAKADIDVLHVKFVSDHEAVVWCAIGVNGNKLLQQIEGRAILVGERWLVTRATFCHLMRLAGVTCPPPLAQ
jgi:hypothetical protein